MMTILLLGDVIEKVKGNTETTDTLQSGQLKMEVKKRREKIKETQRQVIIGHSKTISSNERIKRTREGNGSNGR